MTTTALQQLNAQPRTLTKIFGGVVVVSILAAIATQQYLLAVLPVGLLLLYLCLVDFKKVFFLLLACIPLSTEVYLPGGFGTDLPTEPLIILLMGVFTVYAIKRWRTFNTAFLRHPATLLILLHVGWIFITMITSNLFLISLKFFLAKVWYVVTFYFMAGMLIKTEKDVKTMVWVIFIPLMLTVIIVLFRHAQLGFAFADVNKVVTPFYRNHVNYACLMALFFPFVWLATGWYKRGSLRWWWLVIGLVVLLIGIYFSFTRAAYGAILIALGTYYLVRLRLMKYAIGAALALALGLVAYLATGNTFMEYAPDFNKTITHQEFDNLLEATYKGEDISTMERVYRWVAGFYMSKEELLTGYGPGNFVNFYKSYTVHSFRTYVSDNPERSGIHSYYLLMMVEQGIPGMIIFLLLASYVLIRAEQIYHESPDRNHRRIVLMALLCLVIIFTLLVINDMIETDKVGAFFFICIALLVNWDYKHRPAVAEVHTESTPQV